MSAQVGIFLRKIRQLTWPGLCRPLSKSDKSRNTKQWIITTCVDGLSLSRENSLLRMSAATSEAMALRADLRPGLARAGKDDEMQ
jgi:hypothetical protein